MKIEVYGWNGILVRTIECGGADELDFDGTSPIDPHTGRCNGCDMEYNEEKVQCYKAGSRLWFRDPALMHPNNNFELPDFLPIVSKGRRTDE